MSIKGRRINYGRYSSGSATLPETIFIVNFRWRRLQSICDAGGPLQQSRNRDKKL
jgi:hypothetical protein